MTKPQNLLTAGNRLLNSLDNVDRARLESASRDSKPKAGHIVCSAGDRIDHAYFPNGAILSVIILLADGSSIETVNIGREGAFGLFEAMYTHSTFSQCLTLFQGSLLRVPFDVLRHLFEQSAHTRSLFISYTEALRGQIQQAVACYASHTVQQRILQVAPHDPRPARPRSAIHPRVLIPFVGRQPKIRDACIASDANGRSHQISSGKDPGSRSPWPREALVRVLHCDAKRGDSAVTVRRELKRQPLAHVRHPVDLLEARLIGAC